MAVIINISLDLARDKDILQWLEERDNKSAAVRQSIRHFIANEERVTLAEVLAEIRALPSRLSAGVIVSADLSESEGEEPRAAAANINGLLARLGNGDLD
jgi:Arc/MetJ-type ribon-helix-helix transcriptional regulator